MKLRKFLILILSAVVVAVLAAGLSACDFIFDIFGGEPQFPPYTPPAEEQPDDNPPDDDTDNPDDPVVCAHVYGEWTDEINECTLHKVKRTCALCGNTEYEYIAPVGHNYGEWVDEVNTCTTHTQKRVCSVCDNEETQSLTPSGHSYGEWTDEINTCTQHVQKQTCKLCGDTQTRYLKASGHKYVDGVCEYCKQSVTEGGAEELDKYNGDYGYNYFKQNNLTAQQTLYERIDASARAFHLNNDIDAEPSVLNGKTYYVVSSVSFSDLSLSADEAVSVWKIYKDDNPLYYWLASELTYTFDSLNLLSVEEYAQGAVRSQTNDFVYSKVSEYSLLLDGSDNAYRKALAFHDKIISSIDYAYDASGYPQSAQWAHSIIGVFEERGAVCEGYARTFQLLLNYNGVENVFVSGNGNGEEHAWNLVKLDDNNWYWCDLTWDDTPLWEWGISYYYFLVNDTQLVNWYDSGWSASVDKNFLDNHAPHTPQGEDVQFLYTLPARAESVYSEANGLTVRKTFSIQNMTFAVTGYNTVQLVKCTATGAVTVPETVTYGNVTYTVISIGIIDEKGLFDTGVVFEGTATSISIPKTVQFIWDNAMLCSTNTQFTVDTENEYFCSVEGVLFTKSLSTLVTYPSARADEEYRIPDETANIARNAFAFIKNLSRLYVGKSVNRAGVVSWGSYYDYSGNVLVGEWRNIAYTLKLTDGTGIIVDEENQYFASDENWLYSKDKTCAFCYFNRQTSTIEIPASVMCFGEYVFMNFYSLESFTVAEGNTAFAVQDGILYNKDLTEVIHIPERHSSAE